MNYSTYQTKANEPKRNAQLNLAGKSHYVDDDTLRFHKSRILHTRSTDNGLIFALIESCAADMHNTKRVFRPVIFDVLGDVIERPDLAQSYNTRKQADKAMWDTLNSIDAKQVTLDAVAREKKYNEAQFAELLKIAIA